MSLVHYRVSAHLYFQGFYNALAVRDMNLCSHRLLLTIEEVGDTLYRCESARNRHTPVQQKHSRLHEIRKTGVGCIMFVTINAPKGP